MKLALLFLVLLCAPAFAHDHKRPDLTEWFKEQKNNQGTPCCDGTEAKHIADVEWQSACSFEVEKGETIRTCRYQVYLEKSWWDVPDESVVKSPNLDGEALVWPIFYWKDGKPENGISSVSIRCFMPGAGG
jgi:hypothetical protein